MDNVSRNRTSKKERLFNIKPSKTIFFINNKLIKVVRISRAENLIEYYNIIDGKRQVMLYSDFKKHKKRAYTVIDTARLLNRHDADLRKQMYCGKIPMPIGNQLNGIREFRKKSYYSEDQIFEIRNILSRIHRGRPRKDGGVTNNLIPSEAELRSKMGDAIMLYTRTKDGNFIPVWSEETW
jgi:hypothetical protein